MIKMEVTGTDQIVKALKEILLNQGHDPKDIRKVGIAAAQPIIDHAQSLVPVGKDTHFFMNKSGEQVNITPGNLKRSIKVLRKWSKDPLAVYVGPEIVKGSKSSKRKAVHGTFDGNRTNGYYAHFIEYGTADHFVGKGGKSGFYVKGIRRKPFMRPAFDAASFRAYQIYVNGLERLIDQRASRFERRAA